MKLQRIQVGLPSCMSLILAAKDPRCSSFPVLLWSFTCRLIIEGSTKLCWNLKGISTSPNSAEFVCDVPPSARGGRRQAPWCGMWKFCPSTGWTRCSWLAPLQALDPSWNPRCDLGQSPRKCSLWNVHWTYINSVTILIIMLLCKTCF